MKEYEILYRIRWEDYPLYEQVFAEDEYDAVVEFFKYCTDTRGYAPSEIEIIRLEVV
ncbi:hypothetical protein [Enterococcus phage vB_Efs22_KEN09]